MVPIVHFHHVIGMMQSPYRSGQLYTINNQRWCNFNIGCMLSPWTIDFVVVAVVVSVYAFFFFCLFVQIHTVDIDAVYLGSLLLVRHYYHSWWGIFNLCRLYWYTLDGTMTWIWITWLLVQLVSCCSNRNWGSCQGSPPGDTFTWKERSVMLYIWVLS